jgi:hypothetical protein
MPLSFKNLPRGEDTYDTQYLTNDGNNGKFAQVDGYIQERPLPVGVWQSPYWKEINLAIDVLRAAQTGADGFLVDILRLPTSGDGDWLNHLYQIAAKVRPGFRIIPMFDQAALRQLSAEDVVLELTRVYSHPAAYRLDDGRLLVSAFAPDLGAANLWKQVIDKMAENSKQIAFLPVFLNTHAALDYSTFAFGFSSWGQRDPVSVEKGAAERLIMSLPRTSKLWMQPVAAQDVRPKVPAFWEADGVSLFVESWRQAIEHQSRYVQVITWNDYSETTEVEPSSLTQYVFYDLLAYYISLYKTDREPIITRDAIYYLHRLQLLDAGSIKPYSLRGVTPVSNSVTCIAFLIDNATIEIVQGDHVVRQNGKRGMNILKAQAIPGRPQFRIVRNGNEILSLPGHWEISNKSAVPKPIYVGASTTHPFIN